MTKTNAPHLRGVAVRPRPYLVEKQISA